MADITIDEENINAVDGDGDGDGDFFFTETIVVADSTDEKKSEWVLDSAASVHICKDRAMFDTLQSEGQLGEIKVGNAQKVKIEGVGSVRFKLHDGTVKTALNVKYVPGATANLLSLGVLTSRGYRYVGRRQMCKVYKGKRLILQGRKGARNICYLEGQSLRGKSFCDDKKENKKTEKKNAMRCFRTNCGRSCTRTAFNAFKWTTIQCPKQLTSDGISCGYYVGCYIEDLLRSAETSIGFTRPHKLKFYSPDKMVRFQNNWAGYLYNRFLKGKWLK
ncbi:hypothetical protein OROMI_007909 [Orobanche minor]